jgi:hypothetical protein
MATYQLSRHHLKWPHDESLVGSPHWSNACHLKPDVAGQTTNSGTCTASSEPSRHRSTAVDVMQCCFSMFPPVVEAAVLLLPCKTAGCGADTPSGINGLGNAELVLTPPRSGTAALYMFVLLLEG